MNFVQGSRISNYSNKAPPALDFNQRSILIKTPPALDFNQRIKHKQKIAKHQTKNSKTTNKKYPRSSTEEFENLFGGGGGRRGSLAIIYLLFLTLLVKYCFNRSSGLDERLLK